MAADINLELSVSSASQAVKENKITVVAISNAYVCWFQSVLSQINIHT